MTNKSSEMICPTCGRKIGRFTPGSEVEMKCPKCKNILHLTAPKIISTTKKAANAQR